MRYLIKLCPEIKPTAQPVNEFSEFLAETNEGKKVCLSGDIELINYCRSKYPIKINGSAWPVYGKYWGGRKRRILASSLKPTREKYEYKRSAAVQNQSIRRLESLCQNYQDISEKLVANFTEIMEHFPEASENSKKHTPQYYKKLMQQLHQENLVSLKHGNYLTARERVDVRKAHAGLKGFYQITVNLNTMVFLSGELLSTGRVQPEALRHSSQALLENFPNFDNTQKNFRNFIQDYDQSVEFELAGLEVSMAKTWDALKRKRDVINPARAGKKIQKYENLVHRPIIVNNVRPMTTERIILRKMLMTVKGLNKTVSGQQEFIQYHLKPLSIQISSEQRIKRRLAKTAAQFKENISQGR